MPLAEPTPGPIGITSLQRGLATLLDVLETAAASGRPPMALLLGKEPLVAWDHYPPGDLFDADAGVQVFYHAHAAGDRTSDENGHFHCFVERSRLGDVGAPLAQPEPDGSRELCHVVAISIDPRGLPFELFTTNQWVTDEWLYPADAVIGLLPQFAAVGEHAPLVLRWVAALVTLFTPQIEDLLRERDRALGLNAAGELRALGDRGLEITSALPVDIAAHLAWVESLTPAAPADAIP